MIGGAPNPAPRFATPRNPSRESKGPEVVRIMRALGHRPMPWQVEALDVACEIDPATGEYWYDQVIWLVLRRAGKTTASRAKIVHRALTTQMAYMQYTAQDRNMALKRLERDFYNPLMASVLQPTVQHFSRKTGNEYLEWRTRSQLAIAATTRKSSHGETLHEGHIDEAFAHSDSTVEDGVGPALKNVVGSQKWVLSAAGDASSHFLRGKRDLGRELVASGRETRTCYLEYSAQPDADPADVATLLATHPSIGYNLRADSIMSDREGMTPESLIGWERAWLGWWPRTDLRTRVLPVEAWEGNHVVPDAWNGVPLWILDISPEREYSSIGLAAHSLDPNRKVYLEVVEQLLGTATVVDKLRALRIAHGGDTVVVDKNGAARTFIADLEESGFDVVAIDGPQRVDACGQFHDDVLAKQLAFPNDPVLNDAMEHAKRQFLGGRTFVYVRDTGDITPLYALVFGRWAYLDRLGDEYDVLDSIG